MDSFGVNFYFEAKTKLGHLLTLYDAGIWRPNTRRALLYYTPPPPPLNRVYKAKFPTFCFMSFIIHNTLICMNLKLSN